MSLIDTIRKHLGDKYNPGCVESQHMMSTHGKITVYYLPPIMRKEGEAPLHVRIEGEPDPQGRGRNLEERADYVLKFYEDGRMHFIKSRHFAPSADVAKSMELLGSVLGAVADQYGTARTPSD